MSTCATQQPWFEESCSVADDVDDLLAYSDPTPNLFPVPSNGGGGNQIESLVQLNLDLQNSLSALREEYDILYQEKNQLLIDNKSLQERWKGFQDDRYQQKAYIEQLEAELIEKRKVLASLKKESELTKENVKLKKLVRRLKQEQKYSKVTSKIKGLATNSPSNKRRYDWSVDDDESLESTAKRRTQDSDTMSVIVLSPENPMDNRSPETPLIDFDPATPLPGNGNHSPTASPLPTVSPLPSAPVVDNNDAVMPTVRNGQLLIAASPVALSMPLFNDPSVGSPRSPVVSAPVSPVVVSISQIVEPVPVPVSPVPVSPITAPVSPIAGPVSPIAAPVSPVAAPVSPVAAPVSPIAAPVSPITAPVSPIVAPVSPITAPVSPITAPVSPIAAPVSPITAPVSPIAAPVSPIAAPVSPIAVPVVSETMTPAKSPVSSGQLAPVAQSQDLLATTSPSAMSDDDDDDDDDDDYQEVLRKITSLPLLLSPLPPSPPHSPPPSQASLSSNSQAPLAPSQISPSTLNPQTPSISSLLSLNQELSFPVTPLPPSPCIKTASSRPSSAGSSSACRVNLLKSFSQISETSTSVSQQCAIGGGGDSNHNVIIIDSDDDEMGWESNCKEMLLLPSLLSPLPLSPFPPPTCPSSTIQHIHKPQYFFCSTSGHQSESQVEKELDLREEAKGEASSDLVIDIDPDIKFDSIEPSSQPLDPLIAPLIQSTESLMVDVVAVGYTDLPNDSSSLSETNTKHHSESDLSSTKEEIMKEEVDDKNEKEIVPDNATGQCISTAEDLLSPPTQQQTPSLTPQPSLSSAQPLPVYSQSQLELPDYMKCPHPLPHWLIYSMKQVQDKKEEMLYTAAGNGKKFFIFHSDPTKPIKRAKKKKICNFVYESLTMLMNGSLHLSTAILMLTNKKSIASCHYKAVVLGIIKFLRQGYHPLYAAWRGLSLDKIGQIRKGILDPLNSHYPPPLLPLETLIIALIINIQSMHPQLMTEFMNQLYDEIFSTGLTFHNACAICRIYTALGRLLSGLDQIQGLVCELILQSQQLGLVESVASVWPYSLSRATGSSSPPLFINNRLQPQGLEYQPLSFTLEALAGEGLFKKDKATITAMKNITAFCKWQQNLSPMIRDSLTGCLIEVLKSSSSVSIKVAPDSKPHPSRHACTIVLALRVLAKVRGWKDWTNDVLIGQYLWPLLQQWNKDPESVREATVVCLVRLLGFVGQQGLDSSKSSSINQLQKVLLLILKKRLETAKKVTLAVQIAAVDSLIELCPPTHANYSMVHSVLFQWIQSLQESSATAPIASEYSGKCKLMHQKSY